MNKLKAFFQRDDVRKRWLPIGAVVLVVLILAVILLNNLIPRKITVATDATWPPFESKDPATQQIVGFDIDLMDAIAKKANLEVEYVNMGFDQMLKDLADCKIDAAISLISITEKRTATMAFSDAYFQLGQQLIVRADNTGILGVGYLSGKKVGAQIGTAGAGEVGKLEGVQLIAYDGVSQAVEALEKGELDAVAVDNTLALNLILNSGGAIKSAGPVFAGRDVGIAVCKKDKSLLDRINKGLAAVEDDGLIDTLISKWLTGPM